MPLSKFPSPQILDLWLCFIQLVIYLYSIIILHLHAQSSSPALLFPLNSLMI